jgi:hypothetical protein
MVLQRLAQPFLRLLVLIMVQLTLILTLIRPTTAPSIPPSRSPMRTLGLILLSLSRPRVPLGAILRSSILQIPMPRPLRAQNLLRPCLARNWSKSFPGSKHVSTSSKWFTIGLNSRGCVGARTSNTTLVFLSHFPRGTMATSITSMAQG